MNKTVNLSPSDLVNRNIGFVHKAATDMYRTCILPSGRISDIEREDLFQEGCIALWKCTETFDADKGYTFLTYAGHAVENAMRELIRESISRVESRLIADGWELVYLDALAEDNDGNPTYRNKIIVNPYTKTPEQIVIEEEIWEALHSSFEELSAREQMYLSYRLGLGNDTPKTLTSASKHFHLSKNRAESLEKTALRHLKKGLLKR